MWRPKYKRDYAAAMRKLSELMENESQQVDIMEEEEEELISGQQANVFVSGGVMIDGNEVYQF